MRSKAGNVARTAMALTLLLVSGCASAIPAQKWEPRADADQAKDLAECGKEAGKVDQRDQSAYSDSRYGAAAAMTGRLDQTDLTGKSIERMYQAIVYSCMTRKGWKPAA